MKILLTGSTGYIGRRLLNRLLKESGADIRLLVREPEAINDFSKMDVETIQGDTFNKDALKKALHNIDTAYYLIHSMGSKHGDYAELDRISAENFRDECIVAGVKRIIYLGGLGLKDKTSKHLESRIETGEILSRYPDKIRTVWFRAGVIIGSGGASFEIIKNLVHKLPAMITPRWVDTVTEPVAVDDVIEYLTDSAKLKLKKNIIIDIGCGPMRFRDMLIQAADVFGLKRSVIPVPFFSPKLSSYWLIIITPVPFKIASALIEGLKYETVKQNTNAAVYFPEIKPVSYINALQTAVREVEENEIISRWCDSSGGICYRDERNAVSDAVFTNVQDIPLHGIDEAEIFNSLVSIGGNRSWFRYGFLWKLRGLIDKLTGGAGLNRGRRIPHDLRRGDSLDFWKVIDIQKNKRLLLLAEMKLPGRAWLEFVISNGHLIQTAYFNPRGLGGRLYWFLLLPFHIPVFKNMARQIFRHSSG